MFKNYFQSAWRNLSRNRVYAIINIAGLATGLACTMLILLYIKDEVSFDRFHKNVKNIYRIASVAKMGNKEFRDGMTGYLQGPRFTQNVPGIQSFVRIQDGAEDIRKGDEVQSQSVLYVDSNFFRVFTFPLLYGDPSTCLSGPRSAVVSEDEAKKQFGTKDAIGKLIMIRQDTAFVPYTVTAVARTVPQNSSVQFDVLLPFRETLADAGNQENWYNYFLNTFVVLRPHANRKRVEDEMQKYYVHDASTTFRAMIKKYGGPPDAQMGTYFLQPFTDMHLDAGLPPQNGLTNGSNPIFSYILSGIALFVLLIACINFVNLTVARSVKRAKEIGIRKVIGGGRKQLIMQFLGESFVLSAIAFAAAVIIAQSLLPLFNRLSDKALSLSYLFDWQLVISYAALFVCTALLAGFYPAWVLSGYNPVETLYSRFTIKGKNYLQKSLVVLQFTLASFLIIATFTIYAQFNFLTTEKLGYDDSNLVLLNKPQLRHDQAKIFEDELMKNGDIQGVSARNAGFVQTGARVNGDSNINFVYETVDESYLPLLKIPLFEGRNFSRDFPADSNQSVIVNESFVKEAGWKEPIGQTVNFFYNNNERYRVIGVVKDYHYGSLDQKIKPQLFTMKNSNLYGTFYIKIKPNSASSSLKYIQSSFRKLYPMTPYSYVFKDLENRQQYKAVDKWRQILLFGSALTIFISCIGLFGLSVLAAEKRTKEIGVRKVLGASVPAIAGLLSRDFLQLVAIAIVIAIPVSWLAASKWLENYPYRIALNWTIFAAGSVLVVLVALVTVSFQAMKAASANPVNSLRTE